MNKSFVSLEQCACSVCGQPYDTGAILLDKRMRDKFDKTTITGWGLCQEHQELFDKGYIALVAVDESKSNKLPNGNISPEDAWRLGPVAHITREAFNGIFNVEAGERPAVFCQEEVIEALAAMQEGS